MDRRIRYYITAAAIHPLVVSALRNTGYGLVKTPFDHTCLNGTLSGVDRDNCVLSSMSPYNNGSLSVAAGILGLVPGAIEILVPKRYIAEADRHWFLNIFLHLSRTSGRKSYSEKQLRLYRWSESRRRFAGQICVVALPQLLFIAQLAWVGIQTSVPFASAIAFAHILWPVGSALVQCVWMLLRLVFPSPKARTLIDFWGAIYDAITILYGTAVFGSTVFVDSQYGLTLLIVYPLFFLLSSMLIGLVEASEEELIAREEELELVEECL